MTDLAEPTPALTVEQVFAHYQRPPWNHNMDEKRFSELAVGTVFKCKALYGYYDCVIIKKGRKYAYWRTCHHPDPYNPNADFRRQHLDEKVWVYK